MSIQHLTSREAYKSFERSGDKIVHERKILASLEFADGTFQEIANRAGLSYHQVGRRVASLVEQGKVKDTGRKGLSPSGKGAIVWGIVNVAS